MDTDLAEKKVYYITDTNRKHVFTEAWQTAGIGWKVTIQPPGRTLDQNAKLWPMLEDVSKQVVWYGKKLSREDWKDVFTAALVKATVVPGLDGGFVACGLHTSKMSKRMFCDLIELIYAFGADAAHPVEWSEKARIAWADYQDMKKPRRREVDITPATPALTHQGQK